MSRNPDSAGTPGPTDRPSDGDHRAATNDPIDADTSRSTPVVLDATATRLNGVALVTCRLHNQTTTRRAVTLRDELPGPTLPPRRDGVPERGWSDDTYTTVLPPTTTRAVGYASPVDGPLPDLPAVLVAVTDPAAADTGDRVSHARRELPGWAPPNDVVGGVVADGDIVTDSETAADTEAVTDGGTADDNKTAPADGTTGDDTTDTDSTASRNRTTFRPEPDIGHTDREPFADGTVPTAVAAYLDAAAERIDRAAATADGVQAATDALRDTHHTPVTLEQAVARDEAALRALADRAATLADRAAAADVPVDSLRRLS